MESADEKKTRGEEEGDLFISLMAADTVD